MRRSLLALPVALILVCSTLLLPSPAHAAGPATPSGITALSGTPGPGVGEMTFSWNHDGSNTTGYVLRTALSSWSDTDASMAKAGRNPKTWRFGRTTRKVTFTAAQMATVGAPIGSGNHVYFRLAAVNVDSGGTTATKNFPYLRAGLPMPTAPAAGAGKIRVASFNIRTARATDDSRSWLQRAPDVAAQIVKYNPGVVAMQELGPGRADGQTGTLDGHERQTDSLLRELNKVNGTKYDMVRTTPYVAPGEPTATQGMRILYDNTRYTLKSSCPETTGKSNYSPSCSVVTPILSTDDENDRRRAAIAQFEDKATGANFWFASAHMDQRHSDNATTEGSYDTLRKGQANAISAAIASRNPNNFPVIIAGDFNSWQNNRYGNSPHDTLISQGYYDTSAATTRVNFEYATINHYESPMKPAAQGVGVRIDMILVKGAQGASRFENVMKVTDTQRPSDHNMIVADFAPFTAPKGKWDSPPIKVRPPVHVTPTPPKPGPSPSPSPRS